MEGDHKCSETKTEQTERDNDQPQHVTTHNVTATPLHVGYVRLHINDNSLITTSGQRILMKGRIADLSPLAAANGFVRTWCHLVHGSLNPHESALQTASRSLQPFFRTPLQKPTMFFTGADNPKIARSRWIGFFLAFQSGWAFWQLLAVTLSRRSFLLTRFCRFLLQQSSSKGAWVGVEKSLDRLTFLLSLIQYTLASPAMGHWGTCHPSTYNNFSSVFWPIQNLTATICWQSLRVNTQ